jgi:hypothetical protein
MFMFQQLTLNSSTVSDCHKQLTISTFHNALFIPAIAGNITVVAMLPCSTACGKDNLQHGLWQCYLAAWPVAMLSSSTACGNVTLQH